MYPIEQVAGAIAYLEEFDRAKIEKGEDIVKNPEGFLRDALKQGWTGEYMKREGFVFERGESWLVGHTARLLGIAVEFNITMDKIVVNVRDRGSLPLSKFVDYVKQYGWVEVYKQFAAYCDSLKASAS